MNALWVDVVYMLKVIQLSEFSCFSAFFRLSLSATMVFLFCFCFRYFDRHCFIFLLLYTYVAFDFMTLEVSPSVKSFFDSCFQCFHFRSGPLHPFQKLINLSGCHWCCCMKFWRSDFLSLGAPAQKILKLWHTQSKDVKGLAHSL